jgi:hypothetical protein
LGRGRSTNALEPLFHPRQARIEICEPVEHFAVVLRHFRAKKIAHIVNAAADIANAAVVENGAGKDGQAIIATETVWLSFITADSIVPRDHGSVSARQLQ